MEELYCTKFQGGDEEGNHCNLKFSMSSDDLGCSRSGLDWLSSKDSSDLKIKLYAVRFGFG